MTYRPDKIAGLILVILGLLLYFVIIPQQTDAASNMSFVAPATVPQFIAFLLGLMGVHLLWKPNPVNKTALQNLPQAALIVAIILSGVTLMSWWGFMIAAPALALMLVWQMGERRPLWAGLTVVLVPLLIWLLVVFLLDRVLP
tara:strand:- start:2369 stop:2797 length:429 start_codon:yes stop_codon:yes gene_type:complete